MSIDAKPIEEQIIPAAFGKCECESRCEIEGEQETIEEEQRCYVVQCDYCKGLIEENVQQQKSFKEELCDLINRHSKENGSDTPDFILAEYLNDCLKAFEKSANRRREWYGSELN